MSDFQSENEKTRILVVEDDGPTRALVSQSLRSLGYEIQEAEDGLVAKDLCSKNLPDIIVTDVMMPRCSGTDFVRWLRENIREPFVPVLMLTALGEVDHKVQGLAAGADDYLSKPFHYRELQARVQALLRIRKLTNELYKQSAELLQSNEDLKSAQNALLAKEKELTMVQMAGAAAHNLGQPVTAVLLHCRLLEKGLQSLRENMEGRRDAAADSQILEEASARLKAVKRECETMGEILGKLQSINPADATEYVAGSSIFDLKRS